MVPISRRFDLLMGAFPSRGSMKLLGGAAVVEYDLRNRWMFDEDSVLVRSKRSQVRHRMLEVNVTPSQVDRTSPIMVWRFSGWQGLLQGLRQLPGKIAISPAVSK